MRAAMLAAPLGDKFESPNITLRKTLDLYDTRHI